MPHDVAEQKYVLTQEVSLLEAAGQTAGLGCCEISNVYYLRDEQGNPIYEVREESNCCCRAFCSPLHEFNLKVIDHGTKQQVMTFYHPFKAPPCCPVFMECCMSEMIAYDGAVDARTGACCGRMCGNGGCCGSCCGGVDNPSEARKAAVPLGYTKQPKWGGGFKPTVNLWSEFEKDDEGWVNGKGESNKTIVGPCCCIGGLLGECCCDIGFNVHEGSSKEGKQTGAITKMKPVGFQGAAKELFTDSDTFSIDMPAGASPGIKTGMLATTVLIDYMFFEQQNFECNLLAANPYIRCVCCNLYCLGCICPITLKLQKSEEKK